MTDKERIELIQLRLRDDVYGYPNNVNHNYAEEDIEWLLRKDWPLSGFALYQLIEASKMRLEGGFPYIEQDPS